MMFFDDIYLPFIQHNFCIYAMECIYLSDMSKKAKKCKVYVKALRRQC